MADNVGITPGTGATAAADEIDGVLHQRVKITVGSDGVSRGDVDVTNPMPVRQDDLGSIEQAAEQLNTAKIPTGNDEPLQLVGLHPNFPLPIDTATPMPIAGRDSTGAQRQVAVDEQGGLLLADGAGPFYFEQGAASGARYALTLPTRGYSTITLHLLQNSLVANVGIEQSNDGITWQVIGGFIISSGFLQATQTGNSTGQFLIFPAVARLFRVYMGTPSGTIRGVVYLRSGSIVSFAQIMNSSSGAPVNIQVVNGATVATAGTGIQAIGGPTAAGSAHGSNNPVQISGSDGTNVRRILTDTAGNTAVVGHVTTGATLIPATSNRGPVLVGAADLEQRAQRMVVDGLGRLRIQNEESGTKDDGVIDALNNVVRELKLLNAKLTDLPYYLGINSVMPDDDKAFRDDPTLFNQ
jgi:hypothetical protein